MSNALDRIMDPRPATPEHLRLTQRDTRRSQLKKENKRLTRELTLSQQQLAEAKEALRQARESIPPSERKRGREEESPAVRARNSGLFEKGVIASPSM